MMFCITRPHPPLPYQMAATIFELYTIRKGESSDSSSENGRKASFEWFSGANRGEIGFVLGSFFGDFSVFLLILNGLVASPPRFFQLILIGGEGGPVHRLLTLENSSPPAAWSPQSGFLISQATHDANSLRGQTGCF